MSAIKTLVAIDAGKRVSVGEEKSPPEYPIMAIKYIYMYKLKKYSKYLYAIFNVKYSTLQFLRTFHVYCYNYCGK